MTASTAFSVNGTSAIKLIAAASTLNAIVQNRGGYNIYIGGSGVTDTNGLEIQSGQTFNLSLTNLSLTDEIWAVAISSAGSNTSNVRVLTY